MIQQIVLITRPFLTSKVLVQFNKQSSEQSLFLAPVSQEAIPLKAFVSLITFSMMPTCSSFPLSLKKERFLFSVVSISIL